MPTTHPEHVPEWPHIGAIARADGTGSITINGTERPCVAQSPQHLRAGLMSRCAAIAQRVNRPVRITVDDGAMVLYLAVRPNGIVQLLEDHTITSAKDLTPFEGPCRSCQTMQPITAQTCDQCHIDTPHCVDQAPFSAHVAPEPVPQPHISPSEQRPVPLPPTTLRLLFNTQPEPVDVTAPIAIGRNPKLIDGYERVCVNSPQRLLSRTHALIHFDQTQRILITDISSGNGIEVQAEPPFWCEPSVAYLVQPGTTLKMGDVTCTVNFI